MANVKPQLLQFFRHSWPATLIECKHSTAVQRITAQRQLMLLPDMRQKHHIRALAPLMLVNKHCRAVVGSSDGSEKPESHAG